MTNFYQTVCLIVLAIASVCLGAYIPGQQSQELLQTLGTMLMGAAARHLIANPTQGASPEK